ncbi:MAG TPA: hypothetical protein VHA14_20900 [Bryobacteraceae bacterium]|nr:hypothetical protein [Bryobacteraceae bacterium]
MRGFYRIFGRIAILAVCAGAPAAFAQYGGRANEVVLYLVNTKGSPAPQIVPSTTVNTATGFTIIDPRTQTPAPFGSDFPGEFYVNLHNESNDNFRYIIQKEGIVTQHNTFLGPAKLFIAEGMDRLLIPAQADPSDLTAGLFAPFPQGVDFGPEVPEVEAHSFLWTPASVFPLLQPADPSYHSPLDPPGKDGSQYVLSIGTFDALVQWIGWNVTYPNVGWPWGIDARTIDTDSALGSTVRMLRLRPGIKTPTFKISGNTHLAVLSGSVVITPSNGGKPVTLTKFQYAFIPNGYAVSLGNPIPYTGPTELPTF